MSYEMYGTKNIILVRYPKLIDAKVIFGRDELGHVYSPTSLNCGSVGHAQLITEIDGNSNYREEYDKIRAYLETRIKVTPSQKDGEQDLVEGMEGAILYGITGRGCVQYKAKPDYVMDLHIKQSIGIPLHSIMTTVRNSFEEVDIVTFDLVVDLLREEFTDDMIFRKSGIIHRIIDETNLYMKLKSLIVEDYEKEHTKDNSFDINIDKNKVMRYFANRMKEWSLDRRNSGKVYTIIVDNYGGK
jgi:hypothetical protein